MIAIVRLCALALTLGLAACAAREGGFAPAGAVTAGPRAEAAIRTHVFSDWPGPQIPVWVYRPPTAGANAPVMIVMHGVQRDADRYLKEWIPVADAWNVVIACPQFTRENFPGAQGYNLGAVLDEAGRPRPRESWSYAAIEPIFQDLRRREGLRTPRFQFYGHSAGGQFVHRAMLFSPPRSADRAIAANAGFYTRADAEEAWPFGLAGAPLPEAAERAWYGRSMTILLGTADNDPNHPSLNREPQALAQGPHRLARGEFFFAEAQARARAIGASFVWKKAYAPGVGHDNGKMADFAASLFYGASADRPTS